MLSGWTTTNLITNFVHSNNDLKIKEVKTVISKPDKKQTPPKFTVAFAENSLKLLIAHV